MDDDLWGTLLRFHREVWAPDFRCDLDQAVRASERRIVEEMNRQCAELHRRFDRLEQIGREHRQDPAGR